MTGRGVYYKEYEFHNWKGSLTGRKFLTKKGSFSTVRRVSYLGGQFQDWEGGFNIGR